jgi:transforming growth factor-beta-induced protein
MSDKLNLFETLLEDPKLSIFAKFVTAAGLIDALKGAEPFTILAPSNLAFAKLPETKFTALLKPENKENLAELIKYHLLSGNIAAAEMRQLKSAKTLQGQELKITLTDFGFRINGAFLQSRNIEATNGIIHMINTVLAPAFAAKAG